MFIITMRTIHFLHCSETATFALMNHTPPILARKHHEQPSVFTAENMLREARRQKSLPAANVPQICILDPDGDILNNLLAEDRAARTWLRKQKGLAAG